MLAKGKAVKKTPTAVTAGAFFVVAPATRPLAPACLLAAQRTIKARCEGLGVSDAAKIRIFQILEHIGCLKE